MNTPSRGPAISLQRASATLRLTSLELHLVRVASHGQDVDPVGYIREALRAALERDLGREEVAARWTR